MLLPNPIMLMIIAGNLLVVAFTFLYRKRSRRRVERTTQAFSPNNPSGRDVTILSRGKGDAYVGAFTAGMFTLFAMMIFWSSDALVWEITKTSFLLDGEFWLFVLVNLGMFVLLPFILSFMYAGEFFLLSESSLVRARGKKRTEVLWKDVSAINVLNEDENILSVSSPSARIELPRNLKGMDKIFEVAVRRTPETVHDSPGYRYMKYGIKPVESAPIVGTANNKKARSIRIIGLVIAFGVMWVPLFMIPWIGGGVAAILVMVFLFGGLFIGLMGSTRGSAFEVRREVKGISSEEAETIAVAWLREQGVAELFRDPGQIKAIQGTRDAKVWEPYARKSIVMTFNDGPSGTTVLTVMKPASTWYADEVVRERDRTMMAWSGWLDELWARMEKADHPITG